ncbi:protein yellow [Chrysoperla carnea]|uniref:protein yellow n=1 Tax=Chrysoperla carnea TaxID=189513 RepID=UPI001D065411|nr:protein yellow [Chrysoperla carnea]
MLLHLLHHHQRQYSTTSCGRRITMCYYYFLIAFLSLSTTHAMDNLKVAFEWKQLDFNYPSVQDRTEAIENGVFIPENNIPMGLEVYENRLFVTVPRWKDGVPASLTYIHLNDTSKDPKLNPFPNWSAHKLPKSINYNDSTDITEDPPEIVSPFRVRADKYGRLWVLDTGVANLLGNDTVVYTSTQLLIYNLRNDNLLRRYVLPSDQVHKNSFFANIAVEDTDYDDTYAYLGDLSSPGLVIYSFKTGTSWRITHHYFHIDPLAGDFNVNGLKFQWTDALFGLALSAPDTDGFSTLYFHPMASTNEFAVSTRILRNETAAGNSFHEFKLLGNRGPNGQSAVSFLDKNSSVLFYSLVNLNAVACWRTSNPSYTMESQGRIFMSNVTMVYANDIKVDMLGNLWVLSNRLPQFMYSKLNPADVNFRVLTNTVKDAIRGTACDSKLIVPINNRNAIINNNNSGNHLLSIHIGIILLVSGLIGKLF